MLVKVISGLSVVIGTLTIFGSIMAWILNIVTGELDAISATFYSFLILVNGLILALFIYAFSFILKNIQETNENTHRIYKILSQKMGEPHLERQNRSE